MATLYVPIIVNDELNKNRPNLFSVTSKEFSGKKSEFNGRDVSELNSKLKKTFSQQFSFDIYEYGKEKKEGVFKNFSENTLSISLGILCSAYATVHNRQLKEKYDSITVTGNYNIDEDKKIILTDVIFLEEKFKAAQQYAKNHADKSHLFIYVSKNTEIEEGEIDNLLVIRFSPEDSINLVFAEIFESVYTDLQQQSLIPLTSNVNFIETKAFLVEKKKLARLDDWNILLFYGEQNSGKTLVAKELCKYLITVNKCTCDVCSVDEKLEEIILENRKSENNKIIHNYLADKIRKDKNNSQNADILLIDNAQTTNISEFIESLKVYKNYANIVITSWYPIQKAENDIICQHVSNFNIFNLRQFTSFVKDNISPEVLKNNKEEVIDLIDALYENYKNLPGYVPAIVRNLPNNGLKTIITEIKADNLTEFRNKTDFALKQAFNYMDFFSQLVIFAIIGNRLVGKKIKNYSISETITKSILKDENLLSEFMISNAISNLCYLNIIQIRKTEKKTEFIEIKDSVLKWLAFNHSFMPNTEKIREILVPSTISFFYAAKLRNITYIDDYITSVQEPDSINQTLFYLCKYNYEQDKIKAICEKGADPECIIEDSLSALKIANKRNNETLMSLLLQYANNNNDDTYTNEVKDSKYFSEIPDNGNQQCFLMAKYQVTQKLYTEVMGYNPSEEFIGDAKPVNKVSYIDAMIFCNKLSSKHNLQKVYKINGDKVELDKTANGYRLPTPEEWLYAANDLKNLKDINEYAWYKKNTKPKQIMEVGLKKSNCYGLFDLLGNVCELCWNVDRHSVEDYGGNYKNDADFILQFKNCSHTTKNPRVGFRIAKNSGK